MSIAIVGTNTNIGKTFFSCLILKKYGLTQKLIYWKPIQTGTIVDSDTKIVKFFSQLPDNNFYPSLYEFSYPASPDYASYLEGKEINFKYVCETYLKIQDEIKPKKNKLIIELAGGIFVPWNHQYTSLDFLASLKIPILLVVSKHLGTINHTLLTMDACKIRNIPVYGFVGFSFGECNEEIWKSSRESIERFSKIPCLGGYTIEKQMEKEEFQNWCKDYFDRDGKIGNVLSINEV